MKRHEELTEEAELAEDDFELHRILAKMASLHEKGVSHVSYLRESCLLSKSHVSKV